MCMKQAIIALDGGGSNLRILIVDKDTEKELYSKDINSGTNLSTVPDKEKALSNIQNLILDGVNEIKDEYYVKGIGLSSAGTEIEENKKQLENILKETVEKMKQTSHMARMFPPKYYVTNDIEVLLHSADIAIVAGTGTVGAVKYRDIKSYDNTEKEPEETIYKFDGNGHYIGDKGSGYWIAKEVLTRVAEIENLGGYMNSRGEFVEESNSYLRHLVFNRIFEENGITQESISEIIKNKKMPEYVSLVYSATQENNRPFDRAKVGNLFAKIADDAAYMGDEAADDILRQASREIFKNIRSGYKRGNFEEKENCDLLLSGSILVHSDIVRTYLINQVKENYPNVNIKINREKPVWSTIRYVKNKIEDKSKYREEDVR